MRASLLMIALLMLATLGFAADPPNAPSAVKYPASRGPVLTGVTVPVGDLKEEFAPAAIIETAKPKKVVDKKFLFLTGLATATTIADFEMTQNCLARKVCLEADPLMPSNHAAMYASAMPVNAGLFYWSYKLKQKGKKYWWVPTAAAIASHAVGIGTNVRFLK